MNATDMDALNDRRQYLRAWIAGRMDGTPNLRDYGFERRAEFEAALDAYHQVTANAVSELEYLSAERNAAWAARS